MGIVDFIEVSAFLVISLMLLAYPAYSQEGGAEDVCIVYFTGTGCPNCQVTDDFIFNVIEPAYNVNFVVIEYDIYDPEDNGPIADEYVNEYNLPNKIPLVLIEKGYFFVGMDDIRIGLEKAVQYLMTQEGNPCPLIDGTSEPWENIDSDSLPGSPEIIEIPPLEEPPEDVNRTEDVETADDVIVDIEEATKNIQSVVKDVVENENFPAWMLVTVILIIIIIGAGIAFSGKERKKK